MKTFKLLTLLTLTFLTSASALANSVLVVNRQTGKPYIYSGTTGATSGSTESLVKAAMIDCRKEPTAAACTPMKKNNALNECDKDGNKKRAYTTFYTSSGYVAFMGCGRDEESARNLLHSLCGCPCSVHDLESGACKASAANARCTVCQAQEFGDNPDSDEL